VKRRLGGWCEMAANQEPSWLSVDKSSAGAAVTKGPERRKVRLIFPIRHRINGFRASSIVRILKRTETDQFAKCRVFYVIIL
jgi:hypothetical protein